MTSMPLRARPLDLVAAEWIKLRSLRSTYLVLLTAAVIASGIGVLVCHVDAGQWPRMTPGQRAGFDPMAGLVAAATGLGAALISFAAGQAILSGQHIGMSLGQPGAARAVIAAGVFLGSVTLIGLGLGVLIRHAAGALSVIVVVLFLAPLFLHGGSHWVVEIGNALPGTAIRRLVSRQPWPGAPSISESVLVMIAYPVVVLAAATLVIHRRDA